MLSSPQFELFRTKFYDKYSFPIRCTDRFSLNFGIHSTDDICIYGASLCLRCVCRSGAFTVLFFQLLECGCTIHISLSLLGCSCVCVRVCVHEYVIASKRVDSLGFDYKLARRWTKCSHSTETDFTLSFEQFSSSNNRLVRCASNFFLSIDQSWLVTFCF